jgi:hypothetical protein
MINEFCWTTPAPACLPLNPAGVCGWLFCLRDDGSPESPDKHSNTSKEKQGRHKGEDQGARGGTVGAIEAGKRVGGGAWRTLNCRYALGGASASAAGRAGARERDMYRGTPLAGASLV